MKSYKNFMGIDIGKNDFFVATYSVKKVTRYENTTKGIDRFIKDYESCLKQSFFVLETTGGHEEALLLRLCEHQMAVHRANTRQVKHFVYSHGIHAKTDHVDARSLALYGYERHEKLAIYQPKSEHQNELEKLVRRREELKSMIVSEKNRLQSPGMMLTEVKQSYHSLLSTLKEELKRITQAINERLKKDALLAAKKDVLKTIPGIGDVVATELVVRLPELGQMGRRQIASLVGLAPRARDSGRKSGYRSIGHGREGIKPMLFLAAMAARRSNSRLKAFYTQMVERGKKKMVALTALMRKLLVIANARVKEFLTTGHYNTNLS